MHRPEALFKAALDRQRAGDFAAAERLYREALAIDPALTPARVNLAIVLRGAGRLAEALDILDEPAHGADHPAPLHSERALILLGLHRYEEAEAAMRAALDTDRSAADAHYNLAQLLMSQGRYREAMGCFDEAVQRDPSEARLHDGLGTAQFALGDLEAASRSFLRSIERQPRHAPAWCHLGDVDRARGAFASAHIAYGCALTLDPDHAMARWGQTLAWLAAGDFERGWPAYDRRFETGIVKLPAVRARPWQTEPIQGRRLLVLGEQGVGDEIMFARFALALVRKGAHPILTCDARLASLFRRSLAGVDVEGVRGQPEEGALAADFSVPAGSLPSRFWRAGESKPPDPPYLEAEPTLLTKWRSRYAALGHELKVGISWRGGGDPLVRSRRSTSLDVWAPIFSAPGLCLINLQYGDCAAELAGLQTETGVKLHDWSDSDPLRELDDFAAKVAALDLVISVDNATVHLAGALGRPTFVMLATPADWRWLTQRADTPWYPSAQLFRQSAPGQWSSAFERAASALDGMLQVRRLSIAPSRPARGRRIAFLNDTSNWYHFGCTATSMALKEGMIERGFDVGSIATERLQRCMPVPERLADFDSASFFERFRASNADLIGVMEAADLIVMNGEGSLHGTSDYARILLYVAYCAASKLGRRVQIVNHSCYPENAARISEPMANALYKKVYDLLDFIAVREPLSAEILTALGCAPTLAFDCLPLYVAKHYRERAPRRRSGVVIAGSVAWRPEALPALGRLIALAHDRREPVSVLIGAQANQAHDDQAFVAALRAAVPTGWALLEAKSMTSWLDTLAAAQLLVSGRFHHTVAAACLNTPFVALCSNTPKMEAMLRMIEQPAPLAYDDPALSEGLVARATAVLERGEPPLARETIERLEQLGRLNFSALEAAPKATRALP